MERGDSLESVAHGNSAVARPAPSVPATPQIPALDGFRAIAIIIVMLSHVGLNKVVPGQFGVTLFFFLSGYLITTLLRREYERRGNFSFKAFYLRRAVRILPPMWISIVLAVAFSLAGLIWPLNFDALIFDFLFLSNYFPESRIPIGLWSLAVEEHFYLLFPAVAIALVTRWNAKSCALFCAAFCVAALGVRIFEVSRLEDFTYVNFWTHTRLDSILFGAILAMWNNPVIDEGDRLPGPVPSYVIGLALLAIGFIIRDEVFRQTLRYTIQGVALLLIFNAAIRDERYARRILDTAILRFVALLSYTLYLVHWIFVIAAAPLAEHIGEVASVSLALAASFVFAYGVHIWVERPLAKWRKTVENRWRAKTSAEVTTLQEGTRA